MTGAPLPGPIGRYQIVERLGKGNMGTVYRAYDPQICRTVAIKILDAHDDLFLKEVRAAGALTHPHVVTIYDCARVDGQSIIVMEYIDGRTLAELLRMRETMSLPFKLRLIGQLCSALDYAHDRNIIHRDIKPANLMVDRNLQLKVLDFGIARIGDGSVGEEGAVVGTIKYMSPEQASGRPVDRRSDIFSVGVVLYELLSSHHPFPGRTPAEVVHAVLHQQPRPLTDLCPDLHPDYWRVVSTALQKDPARRFASLAPMAADLRRIPSATPSAARFTVGPDTIVIDRESATRTIPRSEPPPPPREERLRPDPAPVIPSSRHADALLSPLVWLAIVVPMLAAIAITAVILRQPADPLSVNRPLSPVTRSAETQPAGVNSQGLGRPSAGVKDLPASPRRGSATAASASATKPANAAEPYAAAVTLLSSGPGRTDPAQALRLLEQACDGGDVRGCRQAAQMLDAGRGVARDLSRAAVFYRRGCERRDGAACTRLGFMYRDGLGLSPNPAAAADMFVQGCNLGAFDACSDAGVAYMRGAAVAKDEARGNAFFTRACDNGHAAGCINLARSYRDGRGIGRDPARASTLLSSTCEAGSTVACVDLAYLLTEGVNGVKDEARAVTLFQRACDTGAAVACVNLGVAYSRGTVVAKDDAKAATLYERGCSAGEARGCANLAVLYAGGRGVVKDDARANLLWKTACDAALSDACQVLAQRSERGVGMEARPPASISPNPAVPEPPGVPQPRN